MDKRDSFHLTLLYHKTAESGRGGRLGKIQTYRDRTKLEKLKGYRASKIDLEGIEEEIERIRAKMERCTSDIKPVTYTGSVASNDQILQLIIQYEERLRYLNKRLEETLLDMQECEEILSELPPNHRKVMRLYYIDGYKWAEVAKRADYTEGHCKDLAAEARKIL